MDLVTSHFLPNISGNKRGKNVTNLAIGVFLLFNVNCWLLVWLKIVHEFWCVEDKRSLA